MELQNLLPLLKTKYHPSLHEARLFFVSNGVMGSNDDGEILDMETARI